MEKNYFSDVANGALCDLVQYTDRVQVMLRDLMEDFFDEHDPKDTTSRSLILHDFPYARVKAEIAYDAIEHVGGFINTLRHVVEVVEAEGLKEERKSA